MALFKAVLPSRLFPGLLLLLPGLLAAADWPMFRGPNQTGVSGETGRELWKFSCPCRPAPHPFEGGPAGYRELARTPIHDGKQCWTMRVPVNGHLYARNNSPGDLVCLDLSGKSSPHRTL